MTTTTNTRTGEVLTRETIAAFRLADSVSFHHTPTDGGEIRLALDGNGDDRIYTAREQRLFPRTDGPRDRMRSVVVGSRLSGYTSNLGPGWNLDSAPEAVAFEMIHSAQFSPDWLTVAALLKPDDVITLEWTADNNTEIIESVGLHHDELRLTIDRAGKRRALSFQLEARVGRDNSARMIRQYGAGRAW